MSQKSKNILVIVESPAKCKKIEEYLGVGYTCISTYGHLRTISHLKDIAIQNNFTPTYSIIDDSLKKKQIEILKKEIKKAKEVIIASDSDREGEMIGYSIIELFNLPLDTKRITFNEVTETAIKVAINNPKTINIDLVNAQKARQILDVLVGFKISPILWKLITKAKGKKNSLSAGRCQTPALRLVYDNHKDMEQNLERRVYNTIGYFTKMNLPFELKKQIEDENMMRDFLDKSIHFEHIYTCSSPSKISKISPDPFTTSRLQQVASNECHFSPKETMSICQNLYEKGYITYMRTDSKEYSIEFIDKITNHITHHYGIDYINSKYINKNVETINVRSNKKTSNYAQEAHEAIRPTDISLEQLPEEMELREKKMYKLIWTNTMESCMANATYNTITAHITSPLNINYSYTTELIIFPGWKIVKKNFTRDNKEYLYLQTKKKDDPITFSKIQSKVTLKGSKLHYTEARLVQLLEEKGIGRPSTFSYLIDKIIDKGYVKKQDIKGKELICNDFELENRENTYKISEIENKREFGNEKSKLVIQPLGIIVIELLNRHFDRLFNYDYTSLMETSLDKISKGDISWIDICSSCNKEIDELLECIKNEKKLQIELDDQNTFLIGKYGPVIKCVEDKNGKEEVIFKQVRTDINIDIDKIRLGEYKKEDIIVDNDNIDSKSLSNSLRILGKYNSLDLILKKGKYGLYVSWGDNYKSLKELGNRPIENITLEEVKKILEDGSNIIREINADLSIRKGPKGDYIFHKNNKMKKPLFYDIKSFNIEKKEDYKTCDIDILKSWVYEKYIKNK